MVIDILCLIIVGSSFYMGYSKGIIKSVFGILSILFAVLFTLKFSFVTINIVERMMHTDPRLSILIGFVFTFLIVMVCIRLAGSGFERVLETAHINLINQLAGGLASALIALALFSSVIYFTNKLKLLTDENKSASFTYPLLEAMPAKSRWAIDKCKPLFSEFWQKTQDALNQVEQSIPKENQNPKKEL
ncbi:MAG: CvpA family protein [Saprospiraceae bacterium]